MKLQMAIDTFSPKQIYEVVDNINSIIDIVEVGTPIIIEHGLVPVKNLKKSFPNLCVLADTKIIDGGSLEAQAAIENLSDIVTVLALADDLTVSKVISIFHQKKKSVMADMIGVTNIIKRAKELLNLGVDYICVHTGVDSQVEGYSPLKSLEQIVTTVPPFQLAVAGGINLSNISLYAKLHPEIIISGSGICNSTNMKETINEMRRVIQQYENT